MCCALGILKLQQGSELNPTETIKSSVEMEDLGSLATQHVDIAFPEAPHDQMETIGGLELHYAQSEQQHRWDVTDMTAADPLKVLRPTGECTVHEQLRLLLTFLHDMNSRDCPVSLESKRRRSKVESMGDLIAPKLAAAEPKFFRNLKPQSVTNYLLGSKTSKRSWNGLLALMRDVSAAPPEYRLRPNNQMVTLMIELHHRFEAPNPIEVAGPASRVPSAQLALMPPPPSSEDDDAQVLSPARSAAARDRRCKAAVGGHLGARGDSAARFDMPSLLADQRLSARLRRLESAGHGLSPDDLGEDYAWTHEVRGLTEAFLRAVRALGATNEALKQYTCASVMDTLAPVIPPMLAAAVRAAVARHATGAAVVPPNSLQMANATAQTYSSPPPPKMRCMTESD